MAMKVIVLFCVTLLAINAVYGDFINVRNQNVTETNNRKLNISTYGQDFPIVNGSRVERYGETERDRERRREQDRQRQRRY